MLYLSRMTNESIMIGNNIEIKVMSMDGNRVCIGISAPHDISIHRKEVFEKIQFAMKQSKYF